MTKGFTVSVSLVVVLVMSGSPLGAQGLESFVMSSDAAVAAKTRDEISLETARRIADHCFGQAAERSMGVSIFVLSPSGHIVFAVRADGQSPIATETALFKAKTALFMRDSTHALMNRMLQDPSFEVRLRPVQAQFDLFLEFRWASDRSRRCVDRRDRRGWNATVGRMERRNLRVQRDDRGDRTAAASSAVCPMIRVPIERKIDSNARPGRGSSHRPTTIRPAE